jgi:chromosome segregation ATPase
MSRIPLLFALLSLLSSAPALVAGPPQGPSGRLVQDPVPALQDEVLRLEKEVARDKSLTEELDVARARLAASQGEIGAARAAWKRVIATREEQLRKEEALNALYPGTPSSLAFAHWAVADARCGLAKAEGDRAALAQELPKVIAYWEGELALLRSQAEASTCSREQLEQGEKALLKALRQARQRLDAVKRK